MSTTRQTRRASSFHSSTTSSMAKRQAASSCLEKGAALPKKRAPLGDITNSSNNVSHPAASKGSRTSAPPSSSSLVPCSNKILKVKKGPSLGSVSTSFSRSVLVEKKPALSIASKVAPILRSIDGVPATVSTCSVAKMDVSSTKSDGGSVSMDETMSTCDSFRSPQVEYIDDNDIPTVVSISRKTIGSLYISDVEPTGYACSQDTYVDMETDDKIVNVDDNFEDPQLCATIACDIYRHLRSSESKKRPATDFMERVQEDINASMRSILIDWLVEVAEEYRLVPDTLYLTVNYIDRYLSGNVMNRQRLQLLGVACMMIAAKYEEICAPQVEEFCYITDNTYFRDEVLEMESSVLNYLKFEMTAPTSKCFLRRFIRIAQGVDEVPSMQFECLANYIAELSLLEYNMLCYAPSLVAASVIFLAKFILFPSKRPWNSTLQHYTLYRPSDLYDCVKDLLRLCCDNYNSTLPAVREKYSQHKYKFVAKKYCPPSIPQEFFHDQPY